jgi:WD40 repeat protein
MCASENGGEPILFVSYHSGTLCRYSLPDLKVLAKGERTTPVGMSDLLLTRSKEDMVLLGVTPYYTNDKGFHQRLRMWHSETLEELWSHGFGSRFFPESIENISYPGRNLVLICLAKGGFEVWDLDLLALVVANASPCIRAWAIVQDGKCIVVSVGEREKGSIRPLANDSMDLILIEVPLDPRGNFFSRSFPIQNRKCFMSADSYQAVVWNLQELLPFLLNREAPNWFGGSQNTSELAFDPKENHLYAAMPGQDRILGMNAATGQILQDRKFEEVYGIAFNRGEELVASNSCGLIRFTASRSSAPEKCLEFDRDLALPPAISVLVTRRNLCLAFGGDPHEVNLFDFRSSNKLQVQDEFDIKDRRLPLMASLDDGDTVRLVFYDLSDRVLFAELLLEKEGPARITKYKWHQMPKDVGDGSCLTATTLGAFPVAAAATHDGMLALISFLDARLIASKRNCHIRTISALAFGFYAGESRLVSGGIDGIVRIWSLPLTRIETCINDTLECVLEIEVGAPVNTIAWSGKKLAVGTNQGTVLFDLAE